MSLRELMNQFAEFQGIEEFLPDHMVTKLVTKQLYLIWSIRLTNRPVRELLTAGSQTSARSAHRPSSLQIGLSLRTDVVCQPDGTYSKNRP